VSNGNRPTTYDDVQYQSGGRIIMIALDDSAAGRACVVLLQRGEVFYVLEVESGFADTVPKKRSGPCSV
jgi:hypothetical protein